MTKPDEVTVSDAEVSWFDKRYEELRAQYPENVIECQRRTMQEWLAARVLDALSEKPEDWANDTHLMCARSHNALRAAVLRGPQ